MERDLLLLDIDGVCLDLLGAVKQVYPCFKPDNVLSYDCKEGNYGMKSEELLACFGNPVIMEKAKPYYGVKRAIDLLKRHYRVEAYTAVDDACRMIRMEQLKSLGLLHNAHVYSGFNKPEIPCDILIDDCPDVLSAYSQVGEKVIITRSYNVDYNNAVRYKSLLEFARGVC